MSDDNKHKHHKKLRIECYDAYFCLECKVWLEDKCGDLECRYCKDRPDIPNVEEE